jgi:hypothetical protein
MTVKLNDLPQHQRMHWDIVPIRMDLCFKGAFNVQSNTFLNYWNGRNLHFVFFALYYLIHIHITALVEGVFIRYAQFV